MIRLLSKNSDCKCSQESSRIPVLKTVSIHARYVLYIRTLLRSLQAGINSAYPLNENLPRLLSKNLGSVMRFFSVAKKGLCSSRMDKKK